MFGRSDRFRYYDYDYGRLLLPGPGDANLPGQAVPPLMKTLKTRTRKWNSRTDKLNHQITESKLLDVSRYLTPGAVESDEFRRDATRYFYGVVDQRHFKKSLLDSLDACVDFRKIGSHSVYVPGLSEYAALTLNDRSGYVSANVCKTGLLYNSTISGCQKLTPFPGPGAYDTDMSLLRKPYHTSNVRGQMECTRGQSKLRSFSKRERREIESYKDKLLDPHINVGSQYLPCIGPYVYRLLNVKSTDTQANEISAQAALVAQDVKTVPSGSKVKRRGKPVSAPSIKKVENTQVAIEHSHDAEPYKGLVRSMIQARGRVSMATSHIDVARKSHSRPSYRVDVSDYSPSSSGYFSEYNSMSTIRDTGSLVAQAHTS